MKRPLDKTAPRVGRIRSGIRSIFKERAVHLSKADTTRRSADPGSANWFIRYLKKLRHRLDISLPGGDRQTVIRNRHFTELCRRFDAMFEMLIKYGESADPGLLHYHLVSRFFEEFAFLEKISPGLDFCMEDFIYARSEFKLWQMSQYDRASLAKSLKNISFDVVEQEKLENMAERLKDSMEYASNNPIFLADLKKKLSADFLRKSVLSQHEKILQLLRSAILSSVGSQSGGENGICRRRVDAIQVQFGNARCNPLQQRVT